MILENCLIAALAALEQGIFGQGRVQRRRRRGRKAQMEGGEEDPNEELFAEPRGLFINNLDRLRQCSGLNVWGQFKGASGSPSPLLWLEKKGCRLLLASLGAKHPWLMKRSTTNMTHKKRFKLHASACANKNRAVLHANDLALRLCVQVVPLPVIRKEHVE